MDVHEPGRPLDSICRLSLTHIGELKNPDLDVRRRLSAKEPPPERGSPEWNGVGAVARENKGGPEAQGQLGIAFERVELRPSEGVGLRLSLGEPAIEVLHEARRVDVRNVPQARDDRIRPCVKERLGQALDAFPRKDRSTSASAGGEHDEPAVQP